MKIYLVGFMGVGKSTLGKRLADGLGCPFFDLDKIIEEGEKKNISSIFAESGEGGFRAIEARYLRATSKLPPSIIATGGGAPCFSENMKWMNETGITLYLKASVDEIFNRLKMEVSGRPLVAQKSEEELKSYIQSLLSERECHYLEANFMVDSDLSIDQLLPPLVHYFDRFFQTA